MYAEKEREMEREEVSGGRRREATNTLEFSITSIKNTNTHSLTHTMLPAPVGSRVAGQESFL